MYLIAQKTVCYLTIGAAHRPPAACPDSPTAQVEALRPKLASVNVGTGAAGDFAATGAAAGDAEVAVQQARI